MTYYRKYNKSRKPKRKNPVWNFLTQRNTRKTRLAIGIILSVVYAGLFYNYVVAPFAQSWRGMYGEADLPQGYSIRGIDISHHQGEINWTKVKGARIGDNPVSFVFIKATQGDSMVDKRYAGNIREAREAGLTCGAYHYFQPGIDAARQAQHFIRHAQLQSGDLPPVLDVEETGDLTLEQLRAETLKWLKIVEKRYGVRPILYTYHKFRKQFLNSRIFDNYPYWIAHYYVDSLQYEGEWKFWQHTDRGRVSGINGYVDFNSYNGSMYDLQQLTIKK